MNRVPEEVEEVLTEYFKILESKLPDFIEAYYIYGSVSLGEYKVGFSDIDFIAVMNRRTAEADINILKEIHRYLQKRFPKRILDGMYILRDDMESPNKEETCLRFNDGRFQGFKKFDSNSIDAFQLQKYGITIKGQDIKNYDYRVNWDSLILNMRENLNTYWLNWKSRCEKFMTVKYIGLFVSLRMIEWGVLGISRLYYTFKERDIISKAGAGEYALRTVPQRWHRIINEAMRLRRGIKKSYYSSAFERRRDALCYMEYIIQSSNNIK